MRTKYEFGTRLLQAEKSDNGFMLEAVREPLKPKGEKWNIPYYCYLFRKDGYFCFLVTMQEVRDALVLEEDEMWKEIRGSLLEMYQGKTIEELEGGSLPDAWFFDTYLYLKSIHALQPCTIRQKCAMIDSEKQ